MSTMAKSDTIPVEDQSLSLRQIVELDPCADSHGRVCGPG